MKGIVFSVVGSLDPSHLLNTLRVSMQITSPAKLDSLTVESCTPPSFINVDKDRNCSSFDRVPNYGIGRIIGPITLRIHHILPVSAWTNPWNGNLSVQTKQTVTMLNDGLFSARVMLAGLHIRQCADEAEQDHDLCRPLHTMFLVASFPGWERQTESV